MFGLLVFVVSVFNCAGSAARLTFNFVHLALGLVLKTVMMMRRVLCRLMLFVLFLDGIRGPRSRIVHLVNLPLRFVLEFVMLLFGNYDVGSGCSESNGSGRNTRGMGGNREEPQ